ncbi:OmpA family protein [Parendozoicomonas haliclonae]|uniref:Peptidoglycan-associated lipoprotein n=1 Tax=Parendozoicomonas haliclonae TaxID=1960125 RepID=A0A1X7AFR1_9GAMM|nr:OmpA family protein [Parendozoicomonas haliclonae]SMA36487.1 Outer membrane protein P6 precursor [Parendozoicomonas haliclonae]
MKFANVAKGVATGLVAVWLVGCASNTQTSGSGTERTLAGENNTQTAVSTPVVDPAVQAVLDSGKVTGSAEQVADLLNKNTVHFAFDSDKLNSSDIQALDVQAAYLTSPVGMGEKLVIEGHTDERGTRTYNLALGERRANAVKNYLVLKGVAASRIEVVSYGFEKPVNPAHTDAAWAENRRAVVIKEKG